MLAILLTGVTVRVLVPVCPELIVRLGALAARLKSGIVTLTKMVVLDGA